MSQSADSVTEADWAEKIVPGPWDPSENPEHSQSSPPAVKEILQGFAKLMEFFWWTYSFCSSSPCSWSNFRIRTLWVSSSSYTTGKFLDSISRINLCFSMDSLLSPANPGKSNPDFTTLKRFSIRSSFSHRVLKNHYKALGQIIWSVKLSGGLVSDQKAYPPWNKGFGFWNQQIPSLVDWLKM